VAAVFDDQVFDNVGAVAGIDTDAADVDLAGFAGAEFVEFENVSALDQHDFADRSAHGGGHFGVQLELAVFAVNWDEIARLDQVDDEFEFFLAGVTGDVDRRACAVFINDVGLAAEEVVDHPVNRLFVAGDDAAGENDGVSLFDFRVLMVVDGGAAERGHRLALRPADEHADFFRRKVLHLAGIDDQPFGNLDVAEIFGDLGRIVHGAADEGDFASVLVREFDREIDAVNRAREAGDKEAALGMRKDFVELAPDGTFAGRVSLALDVGGILKQREHAFLAVLGEGVQIEKLVVGWRGIDFEVASMNDDAQGAVNGERYAVDQAVRDPNRMDCERAQLDALIGAHFAQIGVVEQAVLVELVFDVGERELRAVDRDVEFREDPRQGADVVFVAVREDDAADALAVLD